MQHAYRQPSYYEGGACGYSDASYIAQESALRATFKRLLYNLAKRSLTGGQLLEIGCGYGYLLDEARLFFDRRVGTEFSPQGAEIARTTGADVFVGGVEQIPPEAKFDCVVATQVIEHVYQPLPFVTQIAERTTPGGHIVLATPNIGGVLSKFMGRRWPSFKAPEHVVYFDFQTLSALMRRAGLDDVRRFPYPHAFPLGLLAAKFGLALPPLLAPFKIWMPATTFAVYGRVPNNGRSENLSGGACFAPEPKLRQRIGVMRGSRARAGRCRDFNGRRRATPTVATSGHGSHVADLWS